MTYQRSSKSLTALGLALTVALVASLSPSDTAAQDGGDVNVNLEALGLTPGSNAEGAPRLILKYPGSSTATRSVPQLRYPNVPAPAPRPTPPRATAAPAEQPVTPGRQAIPAPVAQTPKARPASQAEPAAQAKAEPAPQAPAPIPVEVAPRAVEKARAADPAPEETRVAQEPVTQTPAVETPVAETPAEATSHASPDASAETEVAALTPPPTVTELPEPAPAILRVIFDPQTAAIIGSARKDLDAMGESLRYDPRRIELKAYGGTPGDKASEARRISLKRGLAVRAYLIGLGIDSRRIDVRALGGITDTGAPDRVDVAYSGS